MENKVKYIDSCIKARICSYDGRKLVWARFVAVKLDLNKILKIELSANGFYSSRDKEDGRLASEDTQCISLASGYSKEYYPEDLGKLGDEIISLFQEKYGDIEKYLNSPEAYDSFGEKYSDALLTGADPKNYYFI